MKKLHISFAAQNLRIGPQRWIFRRRQRMRFEWLALLAYKRLTGSGSHSWATIAEIGRLPSWAGKTEHHISTNLGRYLQAFEQDHLYLVLARSRWAGPYQLQFAAPGIEFDVPLAEVQKKLRLQSPTFVADRAELLRFTFSYTRSQWLISQGRLTATKVRHRGEDNAYERLMRMAVDPSYSPRLRLTTSLAAVQVLFRLGRFQAARNTLAENFKLMRASGDQVLKARYHIMLAWCHMRGASGPASDRATNAALATARAHAEDSGDRASLGFLAYRTSMHLARKGKVLESVNHLLQAVEAALITGNYDGVEAYCTDVGSILHRLGPEYHGEARCWLLLGIAIARWMKIGRDDAHGEMILGKIYTEIGKQAKLARWWLERAERIAERAGNQVNLADVKMVWGIWHQRFGTRDGEIKTLVQALTIFRGLREFDWRQKERYMAHAFPGVWQDVVRAADSKPQR